MTPSTDNWITNRRPDVFPALVIRFDLTQEIWHIDRSLDIKGWQPWENIPSPPKPKTQRDNDFAWIAAAVNKYFGDFPSTGLDLMHQRYYEELLAYARQSERERVAKEIDELVSDPSSMGFRNRLRAIAKGAT